MIYKPDDLFCLSSLASRIDPQLVSFFFAEVAVFGDDGFRSDFGVVSRVPRGGGTTSDVHDVSGLRLLPP